VATIKEKIGDKPEVLGELNNIDTTLAHLQANAFKIITSLEFEDINRQKLEKILKKLTQVYDNLIKVLILLKVKEKIEEKDSTFIREIRCISDPNEDSSSKQGMIDELLKEFGL
jgi:chemotaxis regulatin CheY-phosphate phosphatase CheZ